MSFRCIFLVYTTLTKAIKNDICVAFIKLSCQDCSTLLLITGVNIILCPLMPSFLIELYYKCVCIGKNNTHRHLLGILGYVLCGCGKEGLVRVFIASLSRVTAHLESLCHRAGTPEERPRACQSDHFGELFCHPALPG